ncbi:hypothetical protein [Sphingobacterium faecium]|uniref:hypothetical protein n=1 Tax=Sphingobacterium faecium TaxID=34087 RepID=UPI002469B077|nr:hypothetical protein [Sphingobacterium faecium]MDH5827978.1 hypothetical protein [Sphingobacterium faecium]
MMSTFLRKIGIIILLLIPNIMFAQENKYAEEQVTYIKKFTDDLNDTTVATDVILSQYIVISNELTDELFDYLKASLDEIRLNIQMKDKSQIQYFNYFDLQKKETRDIDLEGKNPNNIYFLKVKDRLIVALYLDNEKIASFTLVSKGNNLAHFVTY